MTTPARDLLIMLESPAHIACPTYIVGIMSLYERTTESTTTTLYYSEEESSYCQVYNLVSETKLVHNILSIFRQFYL